MKELIGKTINRLFVNENQTILVFDTTEGPIGYEAYGDCCSNSWFNDVIGVPQLLGATVTSVEAADLPDVESGNDGEVIQVYGYKLTTTKGYCDVVFRNSSNGYYGGWLEKTLNLPPEMEEITDDWTA